MNLEPIDKAITEMKRLQHVAREINAARGRGSELDFTLAKIDAYKELGQELLLRIFRKLLWT